MHRRPASSFACQRVYAGAKNGLGRERSPHTAPPSEESSAFWGSDSAPIVLEDDDHSSTTPRRENHGIFGVTRRDFLRNVLARAFRRGVVDLARFHGDTNNA